MADESLDKNHNELTDLDTKLIVKNVWEVLRNILDCFYSLKWNESTKREPRF